MDNDGGLPERMDFHACMTSEYFTLKPLRLVGLNFSLSVDRSIDKRRQVSGFLAAQDEGQAGGMTNRLVGGGLRRDADRSYVVGIPGPGQKKDPCSRSDQPTEHEELRGIREQTGGGRIDQRSDQQRDDTDYTDERSDDPDRPCHACFDAE